jgi:hypothetical protein
LTYSSERVIGYVQSGGVRTGATAYVTTERIVVNKSKGQFDMKAHLLTALLILFAPFVPANIAVAILVGVAATILFVFVKRRRSRKKWPSMKDIDEGIRLFEVKKWQVVSIELKRPGRLRRGYVRITSLSNDVCTLKIVGGKVYRVASSLMMRFDPSTS